jgi:parallel beta-helix repeat protein
MKNIILLTLISILTLTGYSQDVIKSNDTDVFSNLKWDTGSKVIKCSRFGITKPVREMPSLTMPEILSRKYSFVDYPDKRDKPVQIFEYTVEKDGPKYGNDPRIIQTESGSKGSKAPIQNWDGQNASTFRPHDPTGAASSSHYIQAINGDMYKIWDKSGTELRTGYISDLCPGGDGDPIVLYDKPADRWFIAQFEGSSGNGIFIAISQTGDPLGSWYSYTWDSPDFPDYLKFAAWHDGYYMTANYAEKIFAFNRTKMLAGDGTAEAVYQTFSPPTGGAGQTFFVPMAADASDGTLPGSGPCPIFAYQDDGWASATTDAINIWNASVDWTGTPSMTVTLDATINTSSFDASYDVGWDDVAQPGTSQNLDGIGGAMAFRAQFKPWSGYNTAVMNWAVQVTPTQRGIYWCELRQDQTTEVWSLYQEGIYAPGTDNVWLGSIAMNDAGSIALAYNKTNPGDGTYMSLAYTGRLSCDPLGTLPIAETIAMAGSGYQDGINRVGDYAHTCLDPDGITFWHTGEYMFQNGSYDACETRVYSFQLPGSCAPPTVSNVTPTSLYKDRGKQITVTGSDLGGATFEIGGITGSVVSNDGSTAVVNFPAGNYANGTFTATNSSGSDNATVTINTRTTIPVDASAAANSDTHQTIDGAVDGLANWLGIGSFTTSYIIDVAAGTYSESVTLNSDLTPTSSNNLTIQNNSGNEVIIDASGNDYGFDLSTVNYVVVEGFTVHSADVANVYTQGSNNEIAYNKIYNGVVADGIRLVNGGINNIHHNLIYDNERYGLHILGSANNIFKNNTLATNGGAYVPLTNEELFFDDFETDPTSTWTLNGNWNWYSGAPYSGTQMLGIVGNNTADAISPVIDISGYTNIDIECYIRAYSGPDAQDYITGYYSVDGGAYVEFFNTTGDGSTWGTYEIRTGGPVSGSEPYSTIQIKFSAKVGNSEYWLVEDLKISGDEDVVGGNVGSEIYVESGAGNTIQNNIIYAKNGTDYYTLKTESGVTVSSDYNTYFANGNANLFDYNGTIGNSGPMGSNDLNDDPTFVTTGSDFHIQSTSDSYHGGEWPPLTASSGIWTPDGSDSPAIDAGNPADDSSNEPASGGRINQGCYGNTVQASKSLVVTTPVISSLTPNSFYADKGKQITIAGTDLTGATSVTIGGVTGTINSNTAAEIVVTFPAGAYSNNTLTVTTGGGSDTETCTVNTRNTIPVGGGTDYHTTIQSALDGLFAWWGTTAFDADKIIDVYGGTYTEKVTPNVTLSPTSANKLIISNHLGENPVVDASGLSSGFYVGALDYVEISGFAVMNASDENIYTEGDYNVISLNKCYNSPTGTGIILNQASNSTVVNNLVYGNNKYGVRVVASNNVEIDNNTIANNGNEAKGPPLPGIYEPAQLYVESGTGTSVENNIFYALSGAYVYTLKTESGVTISSDYNTYYKNGNTFLVNYGETPYADLAAWTGNGAGTNDLESDPLFVNGTDFHIQSTDGSYAGGSWPPSVAAGGVWTTDASSSPALDAGNPSDSYTNEPAGGTAINQGCYGNTVQASKTVGFTWEGDDATSPTDWNVGQNWSGGSVPTSAGDVIIPSGLTNYPVIDVLDATCKSITVDNGAILSISTGTLSVTGDWTNNGTFNGGSGKVVFAGSVDQILGGTQTSSFNDLDVNNASVLQLAGGISVAGTLTMISGSLNVADQTIDLANSGQLSGESSVNMVYGTTGTIIADNRAGEIGGGRNIAGLGIEIASLSAISDLDLVRGMASQTGSTKSSLRKYFDIRATPDVGLSASMKMYYFEHEFDVDNGGIDEADFVLYRSTDGGTSWSEQTDAVVNTTNQTISLSAIDAFSRWTISSKTTQPLPVQWLNYSAVCKNNGILVEWSTAAEINNDFFTVEKIIEDRFKEIAVIDGSGNSNTQKSYSYFDADLKKDNYYRIKQTDYDNKSEYSPVFHTTCNNVAPLFEEPHFNIYPNPFNNQIVVEVVRSNSDIVNIEIINNTGLTIRQNLMSFEYASNARMTIDTGAIPSGIYLVKITAGNYVKTHKMIKN